ncbi:MAG: Fe-S cluster assembly ATPase SufC [Thermoflexales bacterium]|nr:Fe-S cluster assembly ATPase SufC [Thermoflexales bacterium]
MTEKWFEIRDLHVQLESGREILKGLNLSIGAGEIHAIMGPNGSGKSTLAYTLMGHPGYVVTGGEVLFKGQNILELEPDERNRAGVFLAFQYPVAIPGVTVANFLRTALNARIKAEAAAQNGGITPSTVKGMPIPEFRKRLREAMAVLKVDDSFAGRYLNDGFSGGEKKRAEILQMAMLKPELAVLDETDSGLDIDALRIVSEGVMTLHERNPQMGVLVITHYQRLLNYIKPQFVHVLIDGRIVESGGPGLALELETRGYDWLREPEAGQ